MVACKEGSARISVRAGIVCARARIGMIRDQRRIPVIVVMISSFFSLSPRVSHVGFTRKFHYGNKLPASGCHRRRRVWHSLVMLLYNSTVLIEITDFLSAAQPYIFQPNVRLQSNAFHPLITPCSVFGLSARLNFFATFITKISLRSSISYSLQVLPISGRSTSYRN
jgi:ABC-type spermidine/putrescine transport system permease subunit II